MLEVAVHPDPIQVAVDAVRPISARERINPRDAMRQFFIALRFPNLINTGLPLTCKFFHYNKKLYKTIAEQSKGKELVKTLFPHSRKPVISFLRKTGDYAFVTRLTETFSPDAVVEILKWKEMEFTPVVKYHPPIKEYDTVTIRDTGATTVAAIGERRVLNQLHKSILLVPKATDPDPTAAIKGQMHLLRDTDRMLTQLYAIEGMGDYTIPRGNTIRVVHDAVARDFGRANHSNKDITYSEIELRREIEIDGYTFEHPRDTYTMVQTGRDMSICVGGYGGGAVAKYYNIILCYDSTKRLRACVQYTTSSEFSSPGVMQAKGYYNAKLDPDTMDAVKQWADKFNIKYNKCYDMEGEGAPFVPPGERGAVVAPPAVQLPPVGNRAPFAPGGMMPEVNGNMALENRPFQRADGTLCNADGNVLPAAPTPAAQPINNIIFAEEADDAIGL